MPSIFCWPLLEQEDGLDRAEYLSRIGVETRDVARRVEEEVGPHAQSYGLPNERGKAATKSILRPVASAF